MSEDARPTPSTHPAAVHAGRARGYEFFAASFRYPCAHVLEAFAAPLRVEELGAAAPSSDLGAELAAALGRVAELASAMNVAELESEHVRTFGHAVPREFPPFETDFTCAQSFRQTAELADISAFYRAFGVRVAHGAGERVDALPVELEFLHLLAVKAAHALAVGADEGAGLVLDATRQFLNDHLGRWVLSFAARLSEKGGSELYAAVARGLSFWIRTDLGLLGLLEPPQVGQPALLEVRDWTEVAAASADEAVQAELEAGLAAAASVRGPIAVSSDAVPLQGGSGA